MPYKRRDRQRQYDQQRYAQGYFKPGRKRPRGRPPLGDEKRIVVTFRMPASLVGRLNKIVLEGTARGIYPWKTKTAVVEAACHRLFEWLAQQGDALAEDMLLYLRVVDQIEGIGTHRREAQAALSKVSKELSELLQIKAKQEAANYYHATMASILDMNEHTWRDWLIHELRRNFPELQKMTPKGIRIDGFDAAAYSGTDRRRTRTRRTKGH